MMKFGKMLLVGLVVASLSAPSVAAVRPTVKPIDVSVQKSLVQSAHEAGRTGAALKDENEFLPFLGVGLLGTFFSTVAVVSFVAVVNRFVVELPVFGDIFDSIGIGPYGSGSSN